MKKFVLLAFFLNLSFFLEAQNILRGPYLQSATQNSMVLKWKSKSASMFSLQYGLVENDLNFSYLETSSNQDHEVLLDSLLEGKKYFYSLIDSSGSSVEGFFQTLPPEGAQEKLSFVAFGDCGTGTQNQRNVLASVVNYFRDSKIDGMLLLGDNAYNYGLEADFQARFFPVYQDDLLKNTVLWPTPGNHDYADRDWPSDLGDKPFYYDAFTLPTQGESGGLASNSEAYYSFNIGNVHFISLDSYGKEEGKRMSSLLSKQANWLKEDLAQNQLMWTVVYFHHPPFSKGSHNSDTEQELIDIRNNVVPIFDEFGVDLVLSGHSHTYERSFLLNDYSENSEAFSPESHALSNSSANYDGSDNSCPYIKSDSGTVYVVAGTGGWVGGTSEGYPHHAMYYSNSSATGAVIMEVEDNRFNVKYLSESGEILDKFTLMKEVNINQNLSIACGELLELKTSWNGSTVWNESLATFSSLMVDSLANDTLIVARDVLSCFYEEFQIEVLPYPSPEASSNSPVLQGNELQLFSDFKGMGDIIWQGPNGFSSSEKEPIFESAEISNQGIYNLSAFYKNCENSVSLEVEIIPLLNIQEEESHAQLLIYPNPTENFVQINIHSRRKGEYTFEIFNTKGQLLYQNKKMLKAEEDFNFNLDLESISTDSNFLFKLSDKDGFENLKIFKY